MRTQIAAVDGVLADLYNKPVAWINVAAEGRGDNADAALRTVLGYVGATIVEPAGTRVTVTRADVGPDGQILTPELRERLGDVLHAVAGEVRATVCSGA